MILDIIVEGVCKSLLIGKGNTTDKKNITPPPINEVNAIKTNNHETLIPKSQYKEHPYEYKSNKVDYLEQEKIIERSFSNIDSKEESFIIPINHSETKAYHESKKKILKNESSNQENYLQEKPDLVLLPMGSRVITIFVEAGEIVEKIYFTPYGEKVTLRGNYQEESKTLNYVHAK